LLFNKTVSHHLTTYGCRFKVITNLFVGLSCIHSLLPTKSIDSAECIGSSDSMSWPFIRSGPHKIKIIKSIRSHSLLGTQINHSSGSTAIHIHVAVAHSMGLPRLCSVAKDPSGFSIGAGESNRLVGDRSVGASPLTCIGSSYLFTET
jgi:hypothetical protein